MRNVVQLCLAANNILLTRKRNHAFLFFYHHSCVKKGRSLPFPKIFIKNNLGDRMIKQLLSNLKQNERKMI